MGKDLVFYSEYVKSYWKARLGGEQGHVGPVEVRDIPTGPLNPGSWM